MRQSTVTQSERSKAWQIEVTGGVNAGATVTLDAGSYTIGGHVDNDIVLADPTIAGQQMRIDIGADGARATPLAAGVSRRRRGLGIGQTVGLRPGATLRFGETNIRLTGPTARWRGLGWATIPVAMLGVIGAALCAFQLAAPLALAPNPALAAPARPSAADAGEAQSALGRYLSGRGMDAVTLASSSRVVTATGTLLPGDRDAWVAAQQWFDGQFGSHAILVDRVGFATKQDLPKLEIAAVSLLPIPHLITRDGEHYIEGAVLPGGWVIGDITTRAVTLTRGGRSVAIAL